VHNRVQWWQQWEGSGAKGVDCWEGCWLVLGERAAPNVVGQPKNERLEAAAAVAMEYFSYFSSGQANRGCAMEAVNSH
jgi:hypothetical protein